MAEQWISTKQAAELLGVSQRTIQNWVDNGKLKSSRTAGGHRRLNPDDVKNVLQAHHFPNVFSVNSARQLGPQEGEQLRVLIVEDDLSILRLCELRFAEFSIPHTLYLAANAYQGLIMVGKYQPHVIFTDLRMPQIDGLQMIREIIKLPEMQQTRIVVVTGLEAKDIMTMGQLPEGLMVLPKPIPFNTVETLLYQQANQLQLPTTAASFAADQ
jgi:excisionase family DNA binding protein